MKCIVCDAEVPGGEWQCQACGEHLGQWREIDQTAAEFFSEGLLFARASEPFKAVLSLVKASVFAPDDPEVLKTIGMVLAQEEEYDTATFYLSRSLKLAENLGLPRDHDTETALAAAERMEREQQGVPQFLRLQKLPDASSEKADGERQKEAQIQTTTGEENDERGLWNCAYEIENRWRQTFELFAPLLSQDAGRNGDGPAAWDYVQGLLAFRRGDKEAARKLFRSSATKDGRQVGPQAYALYLAAQEQSVESEITALQESCEDQGTLIGTIECLSGLCLGRREIKAGRALLEAGVTLAGVAKEKEVAGRLRAALKELDRYEEKVRPAKKSDPSLDGAPRDSGGPSRSTSAAAGQADEKSVDATPAKEEKLPPESDKAKEDTAKK